MEGGREESQRGRLQMRRKLDTVPGPGPPLASQPRLCWEVCLRCSGVPLGLQEKHPCHFWGSPFSSSSARRLRQACGSAAWAKASWMLAPEVGRGSPQHSSSWYICSSNSWDSRCSSRSVRPLMISSGVFINLNKSLCPGSFLIMFSL